MAELMEFKSGKDLRTTLHDEDTVTCDECGRRESDQAAHEQGWQLVPPVCPDCLRWAVSSDERYFGSPS